jgi:hypothetical protein
MKARFVNHCSILKANHTIGPVHFSVEVCLSDMNDILKVEANIGPCWEVARTGRQKPSHCRLSFLVRSSLLNPTLRAHKPKPIAVLSRPENIRLALGRVRPDGLQECPRGEYIARGGDTKSELGTRAPVRSNELRCVLGGCFPAARRLNKFVHSALLGIGADLSIGRTEEDSIPTYRKARTE